MDKDEILVEETTTPSSEEIKPTEEVVEEAKTVPYDRFSAVVKERNQYKELLETMEDKTVEPTKTPTDFTGDTEDALKLIDERAKAIATKELDNFSRKADLDKTIAENPDFFKFYEIIKVKVKENPTLKWSDALKLAKYDMAIVEAREAGKKEATIKQEEKKKAVVETATKAKVQGPSEEIDPLAKGPDGKYLYSTKELEDVLPRQ